MNKTKIIVTGSAGFIGYSLCVKLLERGDNIIGIDNHNDYYDPKIKDARSERLIKYPNYKHYQADLSDVNRINEIFKNHKPRKVVNLAAQAGVRYSIENPLVYINSNIVGFAYILENCRNHNVEHLVYASTSSVYGANTSMPFSEHDNTNHPLSVYAASKKSNELMAHTYSYLYKLPTTGLRFFTVYGPWGRPDMAFYKFVKNIKENKKIEIFNSGNHFRDFSYVKNIADGVFKACFRSRVLRKKSIKRNTIYNLGNGNKINLMYAIKLIEEKLNKKSKKKLLPLQKGDIKTTLANISKAKKDLKIKSGFSLKQGLSNFIDWYNFYHN